MAARSTVLTIRPRFYRPGRLSPLTTLAIRGVAVLVLVGIALGGHWIDRAGLRDNTDGAVSFLDIVYFTVITVTTVGYGDIVPVSDSARMFDTFVVTPIRIFVFLIFLGSAYSFMLRQGWERWRMGLVRHGLKDHVIVCGYGRSGSAAVGELLERGHACDRIVVVDEDAGRLRLAEELGVATVEGDATHNKVLEIAKVDAASNVIVCPGRDDTAVLIILTCRRLAPDAGIAVSIAAIENELLARDAGASIIVNPVSFGGQLLAQCTTGPHVADYVTDLVTRAGRIELRERAVRAEEEGRSPRDVTGSQIVRIYRGDQAIEVARTGDQRMLAGDWVIELIEKRP
ncbi:potassium channel family protein [Sphingomonadaceae bacterium OTU29MARTA1]|uniref:potassium channel family protein n=1 Tax=Sphingomonas sp. Leaf37 TaxID=2876552 RepID=UPI001E3777CF|nr:potassium channel family protein [Sphingomonas sp. Leaf37]USU05359.1 potassium channel family protein [Sphingomonadaceae bacterium OTU29LAMAA1]USU09033.1 potassium channel family protein [Sphingomonadaceae bacterium OTU29MARTA1]USU12434.1 potassium channel family protein [Sphingomonadaceae bacterium OTU29THOMA1]